MSRTRRARRAELEAERVFALRSLEDLEREHGAGDVDPEDYAELRARYVERAAGALRAIEDDDAALDDPDTAAARPGRWRRVRRALGRRRTRRALGIAAGVSVVAALGLVAAGLAGVRLPGEDATGSINVPLASKVNQQLAEATSAADHGGLVAALQTYDAVLQEVPDQPVALTYRGWLERISGLQAHNESVVRLGDASLAEVAKLHPGYPDGRALDGIALLEDRSDLAGSIVEFRAFLSEKPPTNLLVALGPEIAASFVRAGMAVPVALLAYEGTTTTT